MVSSYKKKTKTCNPIKDGRIKRLFLHGICMCTYSLQCKEHKLIIKTFMTSLKKKGYCLT